LLCLLEANFGPSNLLQDGSMHLFRYFLELANLFQTPCSISRDHLKCVPSRCSVCGDTPFHNFRCRPQQHSRCLLVLIVLQLRFVLRRRRSRLGCFLPAILRRRTIGQRFVYPRDYDTNLNKKCERWLGGGGGVMYLEYRLRCLSLQRLHIYRWRRNIGRSTGREAADRTLAPPQNWRICMFGIS